MFRSVYNSHTPNDMNMFSPLLRTSLLLAALSSAPLLHTSCGGSSSGSVATSGVALNLDDFMSGKTYLRFVDSGVELRPNPTQIGSTSTGEASRTIEGWLCLPSVEVCETSITCTIEQAGAVLELKPDLSTTDAETVRAAFAELGILLGDDITDDDLSQLVSTPIRYRIDTNGATATGITVIPARRQAALTTELTDRPRDSRPSPLSEPEPLPPHRRTPRSHP